MAYQAYQERAKEFEKTAKKMPAERFEQVSLEVKQRWHSSRAEIVSRGTLFVRLVGHMLRKKGQEE